MPLGKSYVDLDSIPDDAEFLVFGAPGTANVKFGALKQLLKSNAVTGGYQGEFDPAQGLPSSAGLKHGDYFLANNSGTAGGVAYLAGDWAVWAGAFVRRRHNYSSANSMSGAQIKTLYEGNVNTNAYTDADKLKVAKSLVFDVAYSPKGGSFDIPNGTSGAYYYAYPSSPATATITATQPPTGTRYLIRNGVGTSTVTIAAGVGSGVQIDVRDPDELTINPGEIAEVVYTGDYMGFKKWSVTNFGAYGTGSGTGDLSETDIDTLAKLNAILTDATLIDTGDPRLSDARTPTAHTSSLITDFEDAVDAVIDANQTVATNTAKRSYPEADEAKVANLPLDTNLALAELQSDVDVNTQAIAALGGGSGDYTVTESGVAGASVTAGRAGILNSSGKWIHADKASEAGVKGRLAVINTTAALDDAITIIKPGGVLSGTFTPGATYCVGTNGVLTTDVPGTGEFYRVVGYGNADGDGLVVRPDETYVKVSDGTVPAHTHAEYVTSDTTEGGTGSVAVGNIVSISQAAYDLLTPDADTLYIITS